MLKFPAPEPLHAAVDRNGFVLSNIVTAGNEHDSHLLTPLVEQVKEKIGKPVAVAAEAAYKTPWISKYLLEQGVIPVLPYTRPRSQKQGFQKNDYV